MSFQTESLCSTESEKNCFLEADEVVENCALESYDSL